MMQFMLFALILGVRAATKAPVTSHERPTLVKQALARNETLYYFGVGSNMLRSKVETRGNEPISILSMQPAVVKGHRLAFNMRGFMPLEPSMGGLEPSGEKGASKPLLAYEHPECHGALIELTADNYERVMRSEGVGLNTTSSRRPPGYQEVVVEAYPYDSRPPVLAVALAVREHAKLRRDKAPSQRYLDILRTGAKELGLRPCYQAFLNQHPSQSVPMWLKRVALYNLIWTMTLSMKLGVRSWSKLQNSVLFAVHASPTAPQWMQAASHLATTGILLPGALLGMMQRGLRRLTKSKDSPFVERMISLLDTERKLAKNATSTA